MRRLACFRYLTLTSAALIAAGLSTPARAQDNDDLQRGVARISVMNGEVSVRRGDSGEWVAGVINAPLMTDDRIATGPNSRAEVEFDAANVLRINRTVCIHSGFQKTIDLLQSRGYELSTVNISEFLKAEGGLTCMSIIFDASAD